VKVQEDVKMSLEEAIRLIQIHERARQGRLRAKFMREIRQQEAREKLAQQRGAPTLDPEVAAVRIQKVNITFLLNSVISFCNYLA
jgi:hypothetical protein